MKDLSCLLLVLAACATAPHAEAPGPLVLEGVSVERVREAARAVVGEVVHSGSIAPVTEGGSVRAVGWIGECGRDVSCAVSTNYGRLAPHTTVEVHFRDLGAATAVDVEIVYEDCVPDVDCQPQRLSSTGRLEREILDGIRVQVEDPQPGTNGRPLR